MIDDFHFIKILSTLSDNINNPYPSNSLLLKHDSFSLKTNVSIENPKSSILPNVARNLQETLSIYNNTIQDPTQLNNTSQTTYTPIAPIQESIHYEIPKGWASVGNVALFGSLFFIPVVIYFSVLYHMRISRTKQGIRERISFVTKHAFNQFALGLKNFYRSRHVRGEDIENLGSEAALYLALQRETLVMILIMTVVVCSILLPLHYTVGSAAVSIDFALGTIQHIKRNANVLWTHVLLIFFTSSLYFRFIRNCRSHVQWAWQYCHVGGTAHATEQWESSVFISSKIPESMSEKEVDKLLRVVFPGQIENLVVIMDRTDATSISNQRMEAQRQIETLQKLIENNANDIYEDSALLLEEKQHEVADLLMLEAQLGNQHAGKAIVTFTDKQWAARFADIRTRRDAVVHAVNQILEADVEVPRDPLLATYDAAARTAAAFTLKDDIIASHLLEWPAILSPDPHDIIWTSWHIHKQVFWVRRLLANVVIVCVLVVLTTPAAFLTLLSSFQLEFHEPSLKSIADNSLIVRFYDSYPMLGAFLFSFMPMLFFLVVNAVLLFTIFVIAKYWEPHYTLSSQQISVMGKSFWFLLFNIVFVPSVAFSSLAGLVGNLIKEQSNPFETIGRIFLVSSGEFTLSYVITQTLVGTAIQLMNVPNALWRFVFGTSVFRPWSSESDLQRIRQTKMSFEFGSEYASFLSTLALIVMFSNTVPIMLPFGMLYFCIKLAVDQYQLYFECGRDNAVLKSRCKIGRAAVTYLPIPLIFYQLVSIGYFSTYVCMPTSPNAIGLDQDSPNVCTIPSANDPNVLISGVLMLRGSVFQLLLLFGLFVYTTSDYLHASMVDAFNEDGLVIGVGLMEQPYVSSLLRTALYELFFDKWFALSRVFFSDNNSNAFMSKTFSSTIPPEFPQSDSLHSSMFQNVMIEESTGLLQGNDDDDDHNNMLSESDNLCSI